MKNRAILSRIRANLNNPKISVKINAMDPETNEVVLTYTSYEEALSNGYVKANISKAVKSGTKYKGYLWGYTE